jgi:hypothetical protein
LNNKFRNWRPLVIKNKPFVFGFFPNPFLAEQLSKITTDLNNWYSNNQNIDRLRDCDNGKKTLRVENENPEYVRFLNEGASKETKELLDYLSSQEINKQIIRTLWIRIIINRKDWYWLDMFFLAMASWLGRDIAKLRLFSQTPHVIPRIELSWIPVGGYINPHTDSVSKILSLFIYLPQGKDEDLGVSLWNNPEFNYRNNHLEDKKLKDDFYKKSYLLYKPNFGNDKLPFFLRNNLSWHSLESVKNPDPNYVRVSINYNLSIEKPIISKIKKLFLIFK